jgi:hypothetical protein
METIYEDPPRGGEVYRPIRWRRVGAVSAFVAVAVAVGVVGYRHVDPVNAHGDPDPWGLRTAYLERAAHAAVPADATAVTVRALPRRWDRDTCDGLDPGWDRLEVDLTFRAPTRASVERGMRSLRWQGADDTDDTDGALLEYAPRGADRWDARADLFRAAGRWQWQFTTAPAEVPSHAC